MPGRDPPGVGWRVRRPCRAPLRDAGLDRPSSRRRAPLTCREACPRAWLLRPSPIDDNSRSSDSCRAFAVPVGISVATGRSRSWGKDPGDRQRVRPRGSAARHGPRLDPGRFAPSACPAERGLGWNRLRGRPGGALLVTSLWNAPVFEHLRPVRSGGLSRTMWRFLGFAAALALRSPGADRLLDRRTTLFR